MKKVNCRVLRKAISVYLDHTQYRSVGHCISGISDYITIDEISEISEARMVLESELE